MKTNIVLSAVFATALAIGSAQANVLIAYNPDGASNNFQLGLFDYSGTLLTTYATGFGNTQRLTVDASGNVYLANAGGGNGNGIFKYNLAANTGGLLVNHADFTPLGLGFNLNNPGEILFAGISANNLATPTIGKIDSTTGAIVAGPLGFGTYTDADYNPTSSKVIGTIGISIAQEFNPTTMAYEANLASITGSSQTSTTLGGMIYYGLNNGQIRSQADVLIYDFGIGSNAYDITNDGTNLIAVDYNSGTVTRFTTAGVVLNTFDVGTTVSGVAYTAVPEPSTWALLGIGMAAVVGLRRRRIA